MLAIFICNMQIAENKIFEGMFEFHFEDFGPETLLNLFT